MPEPTAEIATPEIVERLTLEKRDAATGELFERIELRQDGPSVVTFRRPGQPPESYASGLPYEPEETQMEENPHA